MADSKNSQQFLHDGVVLHSEDELAVAHTFCEYVREMDIGDGRRPNILTMESFAHPGKTMVGNLNDAILSARLIFCSESYYHGDEMGNFSGDVAILHKIPDRFVKLKIEGQKAPAYGCSTLPSVSSFYGLQLGPNWEVEKQAHEKLLKLFCTPVSRDKTVMQPQEGMRSLASNDHLEVMNRSISSTSSLQSFPSLDETVAKQLTGDYQSQSLINSQESQAPDSLNSHGLAMRDLVVDNDADLETREEIFHDASDQQHPLPAPRQTSHPPDLPTERTGLQSQQFNPRAQNPESLLSGPSAPNSGLSAQHTRPAPASLTSVSQRAQDSASDISSAQPASGGENARSTTTASTEGRTATATTATDTASGAGGREGRRSPDGAYARSLPSHNDLGAPPGHQGQNADKDEEKRRIKEQIKQLEQKLREME